MTAAAGLDHLVVAAASLDEGVPWCEATLGVTPGPGRAHALFGTPNRLPRLHSGEHRQTSLEVERGPAGLRAALFTAQGSLVSLIHTEPS